MISKYVKVIMYGFRIAYGTIVLSILFLAGGAGSYKDRVGEICAYIGFELRGVMRCYH